MLLFLTLIVVVVFLSYLPQLIACRKLRMSHVESTVIEASSVDALSSKLLSIGVEELESMGFKFWYYRRMPYAELNSNLCAVEAVMAAEKENVLVLAIVSPAYLPVGNNDVIQVQYRSFVDQDQQVWSSSSLLTQELVIRDVVTFKQHYVSPRELLELHLQNVPSGLGASSLNVSPKDLEQQWSSLFNRELDKRIESKELLKLDDGCIWSLKGLSRPVKLIRHYLSSMKKLKEPFFSKSEELLNDEEVYPGYMERLQYLEDVPAYFSRLEVVGIFLASMILAGVSFQMYAEHLTSALFILLVIFIHEAGHASGMYLFKYKNVKLFFLPFFGGFATGKPPKNSPRGEFLMLLLGPLPGIVLSCIILGFLKPPSDSLMHEYAIISLVINLFNLLPIEPLDGGRMMNLILFNRLPRVQVVFTALSGILLCLTFNIVLVIIGVALLGSLGVQWKSAKVMRDIKKKKETLSLVDYCRMVLPIIRDTKLRKKAPTHQIKSMKSLIDKSMQTNMSVVHAGVFVCLYLSSALILPGILMAHTLTEKANQMDRIAYSSMEELVLAENTFLDERGQVLLGDVPMEEETSQLSS